MFLMPMLILGVSACGDDDGDVGAVPGGPGEEGIVDVSIVSGAETMGDEAFDPNPVRIETGETVRWTNNDTVDHTVTAVDGTWDSGVIPPGETFSREFTEEDEEFEYYCTIHPSQRGTVIVGEPEPEVTPTPADSPSPSPTPTPTDSPSPSPTPTALF